MQLVSLPPELRYSSLFADTSVTAAPQIAKRAKKEVSQEEYQSVMSSLGHAYEVPNFENNTPVAVVGSMIDSYKANNVVTGGISPAHFQSTVNAFEVVSGIAILT